MSASLSSSFSAYSSSQHSAPYSVHSKPTLFLFVKPYYHCESSAQEYIYIYYGTLLKVVQIVLAVAIIWTDFMWRILFLQTFLLAIWLHSTNSSFYMTFHRIWSWQIFPWPLSFHELSSFCWSCLCFCTAKIKKITANKEFTWFLPIWPWNCIIRSDTQKGLIFTKQTFILVQCNAACHWRVKYTYSALSSKWSSGSFLYLGTQVICWHHVPFQSFSQTQLKHLSVLKPEIFLISWCKILFQDCHYKTFSYFFCSPINFTFPHEFKPTICTRLPSSSHGKTVQSDSAHFPCYH